MFFRVYTFMSACNFLFVNRQGNLRMRYPCANNKKQTDRCIIVFLYQLILKMVLPVYVCALQKTRSHSFLILTVIMFGVVLAAAPWVIYTAVRNLDYKKSPHPNPSPAGEGLRNPRPAGEGGAKRRVRAPLCKIQKCRHYF